MSNDPGTPHVRSFHPVRAIAIATLSASLALNFAPPRPAAQAGPPDPGNLAPADRARLAAKAPSTLAGQHYLEMSSMGAIAAGLISPYAQEDGSPVVAPAWPQNAARAPLAIGSSDLIVHSPAAAGMQSETSIAMNANGSVLIAGYNDGRGFSLSPVSLSGVARSTDGGLNWAEVPVGPGGAGVLPSVAGGAVYGDPDVKFDPIRNQFVYSSIYVRPSDGLQGMSLHYSNADGSAWTGPIQITPTFVSGAAADKEFIDVNPQTGRILLSWTEFPSAAAARIKVTHSDDGGITWSPAITLVTAPSTSAGVQSSIPRFQSGQSDATSLAHVVWRITNAAGTRNIGYSRSLDGGATWSAPVALTTDYPAEDQILGVDRINNSPSLAVNHANGNVYVVYQVNNSVGEGDIAFQRSTNAGISFLQRVLLNSNPGSDRAQFYPWVTVDQSNGRIHVIWYDQDSQTSGDLTELMHTSSTDGGVTWSGPAPLFDRPFHVGYGNDTSQPNVGDYNQAVAGNGRLRTVAASTSVMPLFDEAQPGTSLITPDTYYDVREDADNVTSLRLAGIAFSEVNCTAGANGFLDPGEAADFTFGLENYVANPNTSPVTYTHVAAQLTSATPGVVILNGTQSYPDIAPLAALSNMAPFRFWLSDAVTPGAYVDLLLTVTSDQGSIQLPYRLVTGTPGAVVDLINENFESTATGSLPSGWSSVVGGGTSQSAWTVATTLAPAGKAAYHNETTAIGFVRLWSPTVTVPLASAQSYVTLDFDTTYNTEDEPTQAVLAYDGLTLRLTDQTAGATIRSVLAEAFAETLKTGANNHFPKHLPRNNNTAYFQDMSVWAGNSGGPVHVSMKFPGQGMSGRTVQLRFEYTQDSSGLCSSGTCGVSVDNVVLRSVPVVGSACAALTDTAIRKSVTPASAAMGDTLTYTLAYSNAGLAVARGLLITDMMPVSIAVQGIISSGIVITSLSGDGGVYVWSLADLAPGAGGMLTLTGVLTGPAAFGLLTNTAMLAGAESDTDPSNNTSSASFLVVNAPPSISPLANQTVTLGSALTFSVSISDAEKPASTLALTATSGAEDIVPAANIVIGMGDATRPVTITPVLTGTATVTFTVSDADGGSASAAMRVTVLARPITPRLFLPLVSR
jgi:uncharacterized repeat protein (TIGR01451 family)